MGTGLRDLDRAISGLNKSDLILLAARPGMGKTSFALNILLHAGKFSGKTVVFFSLEMSREQLAMRLISNEAFVDNKKLVTGKLGDEDWDKIALASAGESWYEARSVLEVILDGQEEIELIITSPQNPKQKRLVRIPLEGFPKRPPKTTRVRIAVGFLDERTMVVKIVDRGFGELFPKTDAEIRQEVRV